MLRIAIIIGSTRPGRKGEAIAKWAYEIARKRTDADFALLDLATFELPLLDEPMPAARAIENLRLVMASLQVATVRPHVGLSLFTDVERATVFKPTELQEKSLNDVLDHVIAWSGALSVLRKQEGRS